MRPEVGLAAAHVFSRMECKGSFTLAKFVANLPATATVTGRILFNLGDVSNMLLILFVLRQDGQGIVVSYLV
jgi:hypothetical protein